MLLARGFPLSAWDDFTVGMLINFCYAHDRLQRRANGERVPDPDDQYQKLKAMQPQIEEMHQRGEIREERYRSFMQSIKNYERLLTEEV